MSQQRPLAQLYIISLNLEALYQLYIMLRNLQRIIEVSNDNMPIDIRRIECKGICEKDICPDLEVKIGFNWSQILQITTDPTKTQATAEIKKISEHLQLF